MSDPTVSPELTSWVDVSDGSDFPIQNLPFGLFTTVASPRPRVGVAIGDYLVDLVAVQQGSAETFREIDLWGSLAGVFRRGISQVRREVSELLTTGNERLMGLPERGLVPLADVTMLAPSEPGDYVDFYSCIEHATNLGRIFRPDGEPLHPNWRHIPIGYHGQASAIVPSGTPIRRPVGQQRQSDGTVTFGPSTRLDIELEVGFITGRGSQTGTPIDIDDAEAHIAGLVLVNDWSARDIQAWEYTPLGPFLGKSFATTISPWLVTLDALAPFRTPARTQDPPPLPYLRARQPLGLDLNLQVHLNGSQISEGTFRDMYWTMAQQLAHVTSNGAPTRAGDLYASGTVSGSQPSSAGSLIELSSNGSEPIQLQDGTTRTFLEDGDTVNLKGWCESPSQPRIGFGECIGSVTGNL